MKQIKKIEMTKHQKIRIVKTSEMDIEEVLSLIETEVDSGALLHVDYEELKSWISTGMSIVAKSNNEIIAHVSAYLWPISKWAELRAAVVKPEFRHKGIANKMCSSLIKNLREKDDKITIVGFVNKSGKAGDMLKILGFSKTEYENVPKELFTIGKPYRGQASYGYEIFILKKR